MTPEEAAELARMDPHNLRQFIRKGEIKAKLVPGYGRGGRVWDIDPVSSDHGSSELVVVAKNRHITSYDCFVPETLVFHILCGKGMVFTRLEFYARIPATRAGENQPM